MSSAISKIYNFLQYPFTKGNTIGIREENKKSIKSKIFPTQPFRSRKDVNDYRQAIIETENAYKHSRFRVKMQHLYMDTVLNAQVQACMAKRINLTVFKGFSICDKNGMESEKYTKLLNKKWFSDFLTYTIQAQFFGYTLIELGDLIDNEFPNISIIRRDNIITDTYIVTNYLYGQTGSNFLEEPYKDWYVWVPTPTENGISNCGYGLLYKVAMYEIYCRNLIAFNNDKAELYGMPTRVGKTNKKDEDERAEFFNALIDMGSSGAILLDAMEDEISLLESQMNGNGYEIYDNLETRCEKKISKVLLGHADAIDSTPGKLGAGSGKDNPVHEALEQIQKIDTVFTEHIVNTVLLPKIRTLGIYIPEDHYYKVKNNAEKEEQRQREDDSNQKTANLFKTIKDSGVEPDWEYFTERTGIEIEQKEIDEQKEDESEQEMLTNEIKNRLDMIYV